MTLCANWHSSGVNATLIQMQSEKVTFVNVNKYVYNYYIPIYSHTLIYYYHYFTC